MQKLLVDVKYAYINCTAGKSLVSELSLLIGTVATLKSFRRAN